MELRIRGDLAQIQKMIPIVDKMEKANFIMWGYSGFIAPFQYGEHKQETAIIKLTKSGNLVIEHMQSPLIKPDGETPG